MKIFSFVLLMVSQTLFAIDLVYLWVDGSDSQWQAIKKTYQIQYQDQIATLGDSNTTNRYDDNQELRYSLRSIVKFAPFVNHIYIVTMNQIPEWFVPHPKITIVDHKEIFPNHLDLPTFNSQAIESNLHRISGLDEYFIYFNDDVFLGAPVTPEDFFTEEGKIKILLEDSLSPSGPSTIKETTYRTCWRNTNALLDATYKEEPRFRLCHAPFGLRKSFIEETEKLFPFVFTGNSGHKFRCQQDFNVTNGLFQYVWLYQGKAVEGDLDSMMITLRDDSRMERTEFRLRKAKRLQPATFCLQDDMTANSPKTKKLLRKFLESYFPDPAPWEKR